MTPQPLRVAAVQAQAVSGDVEANVASAARWARVAGGRGARLVVLPELFLSGYDPQMWRERPACDVSLDDGRLTPVAEAARDRDLVVLVGASVRHADGSRTVSLLGFSPSGTIGAVYSKQHLWGAERTMFRPGTSGVSTVLDGWTLGLGICYDGCFPEHARAASDDGALGYVCPSAYVVGSEHRRDLYYAARALDNGIYVVVAGLTGPCGELEFSGGTAIYDPQGRTVARVEEGSGVAVADLDASQVDDARRINPYAADRPPSLGSRTVCPLG